MIAMIPPEQLIYPSFDFPHDEDAQLEIESTKPIDVYLAKSGTHNEIKFRDYSPGSENNKYLGKIPSYDGNVTIPKSWRNGTTGFELIFANTSKDAIAVHYEFRYRVYP